ncbi:AAA family ATPase [Roseomonas populi]|uniref:AAA family ATPase n=1 Tax=Roseomonas populi TaxID=3121582 RepID=A0ABT1X638_9PROT|nr:AAA family ATPase [Roseomonas pecuniae]MCR0982637.1 AAA family ATPase [Roseomonas pecuniae]
MRLTTLTLKRYGPFAEKALSLDPMPGRINLVLAPNGAGKSVLRHAFGELLFGIGGQTPMGFRHGYAGMQLSATGLSADGAPIAFTRKKGLKNTLTGEGDAPLDQAWLDRQLGRADRELLAQLYALDTERLRQGGRELLQSGGALAEALLAAAGGLREASALRRSLEEERDKLAPLRRVATRPFYTALDRWTEGRRVLKQSLLRPEEWAAREAELRQAEAARDAGNAAAREAAERLRRLERIRRVRPLLARHAAATAWLEAHPTAPRLPPGLDARLPEARATVARAAHGLETARAALTRLEEEIASIATNDALLALGDEIGALVGMLGLAAQAAEGLPAAEVALAEARARVASALLRLGHPGAENPAALIPSPALVSRLRRLITEDATQAAALAGMPRRLAEAQARLAEAEAALAALPPPGDTDRLEVLLAEIRREGDPTRQLAAARRTLSEAEARLAAALARLPGPRQEAAALVMAAPDPAALERLSGTREAAMQAAGRRAEATERAAAALATARQERARLEAGGTPPSREALALARSRREAGWSLVLRRLSGEAPDLSAEQVYGGERPLPFAYSEAVAGADRVADALWTDAERAAQAESLARVLEEREAGLAAARQEEAEARAVLAAAGAAWEGAVRPLGLDGGAGLPEVQRVLAAREAALGAQQELAAAGAALAEREAWQEGTALRLAHALGEAPALELPVLIDLAEDRLRRHRTAEGERRARQAELDAAREALRGAEQEEAEIALGRDEWRGGWTTAMRQLGQPAEIPPAALEELLGSYDELAKAVGETSRLEAQVADWQRVLARLQAGHAGLCRGLGLPAGSDAVAGVKELDRRQRAEAALAERRAGLIEQRDRQAVLVRNGEAALSEADAALRAVLAAAGAENADAAEERIALALERARQEEARAAAEAELLAGSDGLTIDAVREESEAHPPGTLEAGLEEAQAAGQRHAEEAQAAVARATALDMELQRLAGDDMAVQAAAGEAAAASLLGRTLDDALLMQVAVDLLEAALGAVQDGADDALLRRISAAFSLLTGGAYTGVTSQEDERGTARLALRSRDFPDEETGVDQLSEGTRDGLFLALRLVAIEDQAASGTVLPFVGDDILQSFDDARAAAALQALLALSTTTQVILLSHHEHLRDIAEKCLPGAALHLQRL